MALNWSQDGLDGPQNQRWAKAWLKKKTQTIMILSFAGLERGRQTLIWAVPDLQDFVDKTLRVVRISLLISAIQRVLRSVSGKLFYKSNRKLFSCVCIAWYKHSRGWENSPRLCKPSTSSRVCIAVSNSPNPSRVYIRLCKHGKRFLLLKCKMTVNKITFDRKCNNS